MKLKDKIRIIERNRISDSRGWFLKVINGQEDFLPNHTGEVYLISADPGECRANHYHNKANEWFSVVLGTIEMKIEDVITKEQLTILLTEEYPKTVYVPAGIAHSFNNIGDKPYILATYTDELFVPEDTVSYEICN